MVYIYKKIIGKKPYYYLRASERKGKKVIAKDIAYLGNSIDEVRKSLGRLTQYKDKIRKAYKNIHDFIESSYYLEKVSEKKLKHDYYLGKKLLEIEACNLHYNLVFKKSDEKTKEEIFKNFIIEFAYNTASIEGNTITLEEAQKLLTENLTPKDRTLREIYDLQNSERVFFELLKSNNKINHRSICDIHAKLLRDIDKRSGYRTRDVKVFKSRFKATPAPYVKADMDLLLKWYNKNKYILHPFVLAVLFHHKFEKIHPFMDGNGRTGRILMNYILIKKDFPPLILRKKNRKYYLEQLSEADKCNLTESDIVHYKGLIEFSAMELIDNYWNIFL